MANWEELADADVALEEPPLPGRRRGLLIAASIAALGVVGLLAFAYTKAGAWLVEKADADRIACSNASYDEEPDAPSRAKASSGAGWISRSISRTLPKRPRRWICCGPRTNSRIGSRLRRR